MVKKYNDSLSSNFSFFNLSFSRTSIQVIDRLVECGKILGIELLDHIIIGDGCYTSLKELGKF
ncbi:JAB domain-containing protein [Gottfriedia sp. S16(2024)]